MKTIATLVLLFLATQLQAQQANNSSITVTVENLKSDDGKVIASLFTEENFLKSQPVRSTTAEVVNGKATLTFEDIPAGTYGITAFHDQNGNNSMDFEASGMPLEDYGISNNKFNPYGPPVWSDARFDLAGEPLEFNIRLSR